MATAQTAPAEFGPKAAAIFDILLHVFILSLVLQLLYVFKLRQIEDDSTKEEIGKGIEGLIEKAPVMSETTINLYRAITSEDQYNYERANKLALTRNWFMIAGLGGSAALIYLIMQLACKAKNTSEILRHTVAQNLALLVLVMVIELVFILTVVLKYAAVSGDFLGAVAKERIVNQKKPIEEAGLPRGQIVGIYALSFWALGYLVSTAKRHDEFDPSHNDTMLNTVKHLNFVGILWQATAIVLAINVVFFTLGTEQEKRILRTSVQRVVDDTTKPMWKVLEVLAPEEKALLEEKMRKEVKPAPPTPPDNKKVVMRAIVITLIVFVLCVIASLIKRMMGDAMKQSIPWSAMARTAGIAACCSFLAEFTFLNNIVANYDVMSTQKVRNIVADKFTLKLIKAQKKSE